MTVYVIAGLALGAIYALAGLGIVLTYSTSRVFNFSHGAIAYLVAIFYHEALTSWHWPRVVAAVVSILVLAPGTGLFLWRVVFRFLTSAAPEVGIVATTGLLIAIPAICNFVFGTNPIYTTSGLLPPSTRFFDVLGVNLSRDQIVLFVLTLITAIALGLTMRLSSWGLRTRAIVDAPDIARIRGINVALDTGVSWAIGSAMAGLAGILVAPIIGLDANGYTLLIVASFAAVVAARFTSLWKTFVAAMALGILQELSVEYAPTSGVLSQGLRPSIPFLFMIVFLLYYTQRRGLHSERIQARRLVAAKRGTSRNAAVVRSVLVCALAIAVPLILGDFWLSVVVIGLALAIVFLSFTLVTGEGAMISLGQASIAGIGALVTAYTHEHGWPLILALLVAALIAMPAGALLAVISIRLGDLYLALATLGFGVLMQYLVFQLGIFQNAVGGITIAPPAFGSTPLSESTLYIIVLGAFAVIALVIILARRSTTGMVWSALRTSEVGTAMLGFSPLRVRVSLFAFSAFVGSLGGGLYAIVLGNATPDSFAVLIGVTWLAIIVIFGARSITGALFAGVSYTVIQQLISIHFGTRGTAFAPVLWGVGAVLVAKDPRGIIATHTAQFHWIVAKVRSGRWRSIGQTPVVSGSEAQ